MFTNINVVEERVYAIRIDRLEIGLLSFEFDKLGSNLRGVEFFATMEAFY